MRRLTPVLAVAILGAALIAPSAPAHIQLHTCSGPIHSYNGHKHVTIPEIDLVNTSVGCHFAGAVIRIYIEDGGHYGGWTCHASGIFRTSGSGRGNCKKGHEEMHYDWRID